MAGAREKSEFNPSCNVDQQQLLPSQQQQQISSSNNNNQQQQPQPQTTAAVQLQQQPSLLPSMQAHRHLPQSATDTKEPSNSSYYYHRHHQHILPSTTMNSTQQQELFNNGTTTGIINSSGHQVHHPPQQHHEDESQFSSSAFSAAVPSENNNRDNTEDEEPNNTQLHDFRSKPTNHNHKMPPTTATVTNEFPGHLTNSALRCQPPFTSRANEVHLANLANGSSSSQFSQSVQNRFPLNHPFSHSEGRLKNARHQVVPPNNHSPKLSSLNGHASFHPSDEAQPPYQYNNDTGNGHDIQFGRVTVRHDSYGQPYLTNNYNSQGTTTRDQMSQPRQFSNAFSSTNNNTESVPAKIPPTSTGLLSAFGSSTSVSAATAVANIASLIHATTSSTSLSNDMNNQSPALSVSGVQRPTNVYGPVEVGGNGSMKPSQGHATAAQPDMSEHMLLLQRELEKERMMRMQLQQRVMELGQKVQMQHLVEKSYEDVAHKYKMLLSQMQYMSIAIERYKAVAQQLEQERQRLSTENAALMAQKSTVVNDKTMRYNMLMERSKKLEEENSSLVLENETYQKQYEKCIDGISQQVVQALLTQKALQEQCMQMQDKLIDLERENSEYYEAAVRQARQASSDSRLGYSYRRARTHTSSPSADSVRSMPAQHLYWRQSSVTSLERHNHGESAADKVVDGHFDIKMVDKSAASAHGVSIETEFPANNGSPKSTRRNLEKHPSSSSLDSAHHGRGLGKYSGKDVRCQRSISAEALRDVKVNLRIKPNQTLPKSATLSAMSAIDPANIHTTQAEVHKNLSPESSVAGGELSPPANDPFADDADHILSKHQSLIVGSMEDLFAATASNVRDYVIQEEESGSNSAVSTQGRERGIGVPTPPPRPHSRCLSECSLANEMRTSRHTHFSAANSESRESPPPLPPKQYKGSRRKYKPLPAEPPESCDEADSSDKNTDSESIKQELNVLTSQIAHLTTRSAYHN